MGRKIFNVIPGTKLGAKGYMGARIQPNSPTDHPDDVRWQTFNAFAYATGDIVIGTNPVDSQVKSNIAVQKALKDIVETFKLKDVLPWCVLAHIDVQAEAAKQQAHAARRRVHQDGLSRDRPVGEHAAMRGHRRDAEAGAGSEAHALGQRHGHGRRRPR